MDGGPPRPSVPARFVHTRTPSPCPTPWVLDGGPRVAFRDPARAYPHPRDRIPCGIGWAYGTGAGRSSGTRWSRPSYVGSKDRHEGHRRLTPQGRGNQYAITSSIL